MDERADSLKPESAEQKEAEIERSRARLDGLVTEMDRRRHELGDVRLQLRKHKGLVAAVGGGLVLAIAAVVVFTVRAHRRQSGWRGRAARLRGRADRVREAFG